MVKRLALLAALFVYAGLTSVQSPAASVAISHAVNVAQVSLPPLFSTEDAARAHCSRDVVVWLNIPSGIYHYKGERWYGRTKHGAYACEKEAIKAGDRASENGQ